MNEDLSATIRTGVTVVIVAALVSTVLSLMVVAQTILTSGQGTLQAGVDRVSLQQFELYNGGSQSGTDVKAAVSLYASSDIAILVKTKSSPGTMADDKYYNYNSLLAIGGANPKATPVTVAGQNATAYVIEAGASGAADGKTFKKPNAGDSFYTGALAVSNGIIAFNGDKKGITTKGADQYILDSARFSSQLIKDKNNLIIGIVFRQKD